MEPTGNSDEEQGDPPTRAKVSDRKERSGRRSGRGSCDEELEPVSEVEYGAWNRSECYHIGTGLLAFG